MEQSIQAPQDASPESQAILAELAKEGHTVDGLTPPAPDKPEAKPEDKPADTPKEPQEPSKPTPKVDRGEAKFVPVSKHNEERHKRQEAEERAAAAEKLAAERAAKIAELTEQPHKTESDLDGIRQTAKQLAEEAGYDAEFMTKFAETIVAEARKGTLTQKEIEDKLAPITAAKQQAEQQALEAAQEKGFADEWATVAKEFPELESSKEELKQLAFAEGNEQIPLRTLAIQFKHDNPPGRKTAEVPLGGKKDSTDVIDFENITESEFAALTPKQLDQYYEWQDKHLKFKR